MRLTGFATLAFACLLVLTLSGCASDTDPMRPLSPDEGASLLRDIRTDPSRMQSLTPAERTYLGRTLKR